MWEQLNRVIKPNGAICLFGSEPFSSALRMSNIKIYRYDWIWEKTKYSNFLCLKKQPAKNFENICVFYKKQPIYNPQMRKGKPYKDKGSPRSSNQQTFGTKTKMAVDNKGTRYPNATILFSNGNNKNVHPTQKPVDLLEYLIKTYTNEGETVLDFTMGSGSTGVACINTNRRFIGIELDEGYFNIAKQRIDEAIKGGANG
jgi:site-specific DNA-methyltransferase (adenine-specific)